MVQYESVLYFDSDCLVVRDIEPLFALHKQLHSSANPQSKYHLGVTRDIRASKWQETFNMGVFVLRPNLAEYARLIQLKNDANFKFETTMSEQGFLNVVYKNQWLEIGFENNANLAVYSQLPDYWKAREANISVIHYTMEKPWDCGNTYKPVCDIWRKIS